MSIKPCGVVGDCEVSDEREEKGMNREIKFRGKPIEDVDFDNIGVHISKDDFVYGNLIVDGSQAWIVKGVIESTNDYITLEYWYPCDPNTIGQYTGLKDKNGKEIYEGDRVDFNGSKYFVAIGNYEYQESWDSSHMVFANGVYFMKIGAYQILNDFNKYNMDYVEIIGTIHDKED